MKQKKLIQAMAGIIVLIFAIVIFFTVSDRWLDTKEESFGVLVSEYPELEVLVRRLVREIHKKDFSTIKGLIHEWGMLDSTDVWVEREFWIPRVANDPRMIDELTEKGIADCVKSESDIFPSFFALYEWHGEGYPVRIEKEGINGYNVWMNPDRKEWKGCHFLPMFFRFFIHDGKYYLYQYNSVS